MLAERAEVSANLRERERKRSGRSRSFLREGIMIKFFKDLWNRGSGGKATIVFMGVALLAIVGACLMTALI